MQELPTELIWLIASQLTLKDKRSLRLANSLLERQTRRHFIEEHFCSGQMIIESEYKTFSAIALLGSDDIVEKVHKLFLRHWRVPVRPENTDTILFKQILAKTTNLQQLTIVGLPRSYPASLLPLAGFASALADAGAPIQSLYLERCTVRLQDLQELLTGLTPNLRHLVLDVFCIEDKAWSATLRLLGGLGLGSLEVSDMLQGDPTSAQHVCFFDDTHSTAKRLHEVEVGDSGDHQKYKFSALWALMYGRQAVVAGCEALDGFWDGKRWWM